MEHFRSTLCPFAIAKVLVTSHSCLTDTEINLICGWLRSRTIENLSKCHRLIGDDYLNPQRTALLLQIEALFKKNSDFKSKSCDDVAWRSFLQNEKRCRITSRRIDYFLFTRPERLDPLLLKVLGKAARIIERTLGSYESFLEAIPLELRTTGGATNRKPRSLTSAVDKIRTRYDVSTGCVPLLEATARYFALPLKYRVVNFNRIAFVPKNFKTSRTIACEPEGLLPFQLACDTLLKVRLRRLGVDLRHQGWNQELCRIAATERSHATIDLAAASDSLTIPVLEYLLPASFFQLFMRLRSNYYKSSFGTGRYSKFASMGNGLTFPLETLVFSAIVKACGGNPGVDSAIYGDDIIVPNDLVPLVIRSLRFIGFLANEDKTFISGPFRESCGVNYVDATDVTPFYWRRNPRSKAEDCLVINSLVKRFPEITDLSLLFLKHIQNRNLLIVPFNEDLLSGVHVNTTTSYKLRLLKVDRSKDPNMPCGHLVFRRYLASLKPGDIIPGSSALRGLYYWLTTRLSSSQVRLPRSPLLENPLAVTRHRVSPDSLRYRATTAAWAYHPGSSDHLIELSDMVLALRAKS